MANQSCSLKNKIVVMKAINDVNTMKLRNREIPEKMEEGYQKKQPYDNRSNAK